MTKSSRFQIRAWEVGTVAFVLAALTYCLVIFWSTTWNTKFSLKEKVMHAGVEVSFLVLTYICYARYRKALLASHGQK